MTDSLFCWFTVTQLADLLLLLRCCYCLCCCCCVFVVASAALLLRCYSDVATSAADSVVAPAAAEASVAAAPASPAAPQSRRWQRGKVGCLKAEQLRKEGVWLICKRGGKERRKENKRRRDRKEGSGHWYFQIVIHFILRREREEIGERYNQEKAMDFSIHSLIFNQGFICLYVGYRFITNSQKE